MLRLQIHPCNLTEKMATTTTMVTKENRSAFEETKVAKFQKTISENRQPLAFNRSNNPIKLHAMVEVMTTPSESAAKPGSLTAMPDTKPSPPPLPPEPGKNFDRGGQPTFMPVNLASTSMTTSKIFEGGGQPTVAPVDLASSSITTSKNFDRGGQHTVVPVDLASSSMTTSKIFDGGAQPTVVPVELALSSITTSKNF